MKKARKLLVTLLVLAFVLSTFNVGFAQDAEEKLPAEVVRAQALGILRGDEKGNLNLDKPVTRAEALALIVRISGLEASAELMKGQTQFADVNSDPSLQWATGYINLGVGQGIINGYPDGTFKGNGQVTYAEMAKMLLYAMNYGVTVEGAPWPAAVMGKADDLKLFEDVNAVPNVPALRGDVVKMIDNSLTVKHLVQKGYGDLAYYDEGTETFLSKMKVTELEDVRVTQIARVNDKLDDDEIELTEYDKNGKAVDSDIYTLIADVNPEEIFGLEVDAWVNDDDEVFFIKVKTAEKDILLDTVNGDDSDDKEITLKNAGKTYKWADDAIAYVNFEEVVDFEEIADNAYGKVVLDRGEVAFANLFEFDNVGVVTEVDGKVIKFVDDDTNEEDIDLDDYDDVYVYNPDFSKADVEDIDVDSAIFFWEGEDDDIYIIVKNETVKGEVERVKADKIKVDGKEYSKGSYAILTLDKGDNYEKWAGLANVEDFVDEEVKIILDLRGRVLLVTGSAKATSGNLYGIVTYAKDGRYVTATIFNEEGKEVDYKAESSSELRDLVELKYYASTPEYAALKYKLTSDSEIAEEKSVVAVIKGDEIVKSVDGKGEAVAGVVFEGYVKKDSDKKFFTLLENKDDKNGKRFYITNDTVIMKALNDDGELDPEVISVDRFVSISITDKNKAVVFGESDKDADFIVMLNKDFEGTEEDYLYGVVTDKPYKSGGSYYATINVFGEGEKDYKIADPDHFAKGDVVAFDFNNKGEAVLLKSEIFKEKILTEYDDGYVNISGSVYKVDSAAILYNKDKKISRSKLKDFVGKRIDFAIDDDNIIVAAVVYDGEKPDNGDGDVDAGKVTYIGGTVLEVTLPEGANPADYAVVIGENARGIVDGKADFAGVLENGKIYTAKLVKVAELDKAISTVTFVANIETAPVTERTIEDAKITSISATAIKVKGETTTFKFNDETEFDVDGTVTIGSFDADVVKVGEYVTLVVKGDQVISLALDTVHSGELKAIEALETAKAQLAQAIADAEELLAQEQARVAAISADDQTALGAAYTTYAAEVADTGTFATAINTAKAFDVTGKTATEIDTARTELETAKTAFETAKTAFDTAVSTLETAKAQLAQAIADAEALYNTEKARLDSFTASEIAAINSAESDGYDTYAAALVTFKGAINTAKAFDVTGKTATEIDTARTTLETAKTTFETAKSTFDNLESVKAIGK